MLGQQLSKLHYHVARRDSVSRRTPPVADAFRFCVHCSNFCGRVTSSAGIDGFLFTKARGYARNSAKRVLLNQH